MTLTNPLQLPQGEQFQVGESDFAYFDNFACRCACGAIFFCRSGQAEVTIDQYHGTLEPNTLCLLLPESMFLLTERTQDFSMTYFAFSRDLFIEARRGLSPSFFQGLLEHPISRPPRRNVESAAKWLEVAAYTYHDRQNIFRNTITKNRLQNVFMELYDKQQRFAPTKDQAGNSTRRTELFQRFASLVHDHCQQQREVSFYADLLCISPRYLSTIVRNVTRSSAKEFIDRSVVLEIKILLRSTDLSIQEIAFRLHFPDQSYLGRYFKKQTGMSPSEYRHSTK